MAPRKRTELSILDKINILDSLRDNRNSRKGIMEKYGCDASTITRILQKEILIRQAVEGNSSNTILKRNRVRSEHNEALDKAVARWFNEMRSRNAVIRGPLIKEQAAKFAKILKVTDFEPSNGWLWRWQKRENISLKKVHGNRNDADVPSASQWIKNILPNLLNGYSEKDIFNGDESGLYYNMVPSGTLMRKGEDPAGHKLSKDHITLLFICNMDGSEKFVSAIGKAKDPHCFRGKTIPIPYFHQKSAWMVTELWTQIISDLEEKMKKENRQIILFVDNAVCHKLLSGVRLEHVKIHKLPTTSIIQPLDRGIIRCFKAYYRRNLIRKQLLALESEQTLPDFVKSINVLEALKIIKRSWLLVTPQTIQNCFKKARFVKEGFVGDGEVSEEIDVFSTEEEFDELLNCDDGLECFGCLDEQEISDDVVSFEEYPGTGGEDLKIELPVVENVAEIPSRKDALKAYATLVKYLDGNNLTVRTLDEMEDHFLETTEKSIIQRKISDFLH